MNSVLSSGQGEGSAVSQFLIGGKAREPLFDEQQQDLGKFQSRRYSPDGRRQAAKASAGRALSWMVQSVLSHAVIDAYAWDLRLTLFLLLLPSFSPYRQPVPREDVL